MKNLWKAQVEDPKAFATNVKLLQTVGMFAVAVSVMHRYGEALAV